jgi:hypothetical protein
MPFCGLAASMSQVPPELIMVYWRVQLSHGSPFGPKSALWLSVMVGSLRTPEAAEAVHRHTTRELRLDVDPQV